MVCIRGEPQHPAAAAGRTLDKFEAEKEAFFVTCGRTTMTEEDILGGRLICVIGIALVRPYEFEIFRIVQPTAEAQR